jgi:hypothetical protein
LGEASPFFLTSRETCGPLAGPISIALGLIGRASSPRKADNLAGLNPTDQVLVYCSSSESRVDIAEDSNTMAVSPVPSISEDGLCGLSSLGWYWSGTIRFSTSARRRSNRLQSFQARQKYEMADQQYALCYF